MLSVINQWKSSKHVFHVTVQGMYVEVMRRALKTHLIANLSEQIVIFYVYSQSVGVIYVYMLVL